MTRLEFFKAAMQAGCYARKAWVVSAFSITQDIAPANQWYPYRIVQSPTATHYYTPDGTLAVITDASPGVPLLTFKDRLIVDATVCPNVQTPVETTVGNVLVNLIALVSAFGTKIPFVTGRFSITAIEDQIALRLQDTPAEGAPRDAAAIYVDEYSRFVEALTYITEFSLLSVWTTTAKSMTVAPGFAEYKATLIKEYGDRLRDPVKMAEFEAKLRAFDETYLKDDPTNNTFLAGKVKGVARKKTHLTMGGEAGFGDGLTVTPILNALDEGWPTDPEQYVAMMNGLRLGSYSRGMETVKGGTTAKTFLRAGSNFVILPEDCGTTLGLSREITKANVGNLVGRSVRVKFAWQRIDTLAAATAFIGQQCVVRSPMYCQLPGDRICGQCSGDRLAANPVALSSALIEISSQIMTTALKQMHGTVAEAATLAFHDSLT